MEQSLEDIQDESAWQDQGAANDKAGLIRRMLERGVQPEVVAEIASVPVSRVLGFGEPQDVDRGFRPDAAATEATEATEAKLEPKRLEEVGRPPTVPAGMPACRARRMNIGMRPFSAPCRRLPTAHEVGLAMRRVKLHAFQWKRRAGEFFKDFDLLNSGRRPGEQFIRGLTNLMAPRTLADPTNPVDAEAIVDFFRFTGRLQGQPHLVDFVRFCEEVETVFTEHFLEKTPLRWVPRPGHQVMTWTGFKPKPPADPAAYGWLMNRIRVLCESRGIDLGTCLDDTYWSTIDARAGRLRPEHFLSTFPLTRSTPTVSPALSEEEMQPVMERFTDVDGLFRIFLFQQEVEEFPAPVAYEPRKAATNYSAGFPLQPGRPQTARARTEARTEELSASEPRQRPQTARESRPPERPKAAARPQTAQPRPDVMSIVKSHVAVNRVPLWASFQDFDRLRQGAVSDIGFTNGLTLMGLRLSSEEMRQLFERYQTGDGRFCYKDFCADIDAKLRVEMEEQRSGSSAKEEKLHLQLPAQEEAILQKVHAAVAQYVKARGFDITSMFENYTKPGQASYGHVLVRNFWRAMDDVDVKSLSRADLAVLCKAYCDTEKGNEFNYLNFCAMVDPLHSHLPVASHKRHQQFLKQRLFDFKQCKSPYYDRQGRLRPCPVPPKFGKPGRSRLCNRQITLVG
ncbi:unnamed protein product [Effrenium voratum]|nr:unnamed protein product [Effrenium voratum]